MSILLNLSIIVSMAILNRFRGGGWWSVHLPGHPRWYVTAAVTTLAVLCLRTWQAGVLFGIGYGLWSLLPWGHLYSLGRWFPVRPPSALEATLLRWAGGRYWLALLMLHAIGVSALAPLVWWEFPGPEVLLVLLPPAIVAAYLICWNLDESRAISRAELAVGALWGVALELVRI